MTLIQLILFVFPAGIGSAAMADRVLAKYLPQTQAADLVAGADGFGPIKDDLAVAPVRKGAERVGWAYVASDFVGTRGWSGWPIRVKVALGLTVHVIGVKRVKHSEPVVLIGIPWAKVKALAASHVGMDLVAEAKNNGSGPKPDIISGATVAVMEIDDSIVRSGIKVARALGLGRLKPETDSLPKAAGPRPGSTPPRPPRPTGWGWRAMAQSAA